MVNGSKTISLIILMPPSNEQTKTCSYTSIKTPKCTQLIKKCDYWVKAKLVTISLVNCKLTVNMINV